jgi:transcriptional regulator with XRE-family HTH domain
MNKLQQLKQRAFENPAVREEYDALSEEFELINNLLKMRATAGLTQEQVALRMKTKKSNISRLESVNGNPSWKTIRKYATACGFKVSIDIQEGKQKSA